MNITNIIALLCMNIALLFKQIASLFLFIFAGENSA
jgi:predicted transcriptional regulator YheO